MRRFALVCVDLTNEAVDRLFCYAVPEEMQTSIVAGMRVLVPFGSRDKPIDGYVMELTDDAPEYKLKAIAGFYEDYPLFSAEMFELALWMRDKYYTTLANCLRCILPPGLAKKPGAGRPLVFERLAEKALLEMAPFALTEEQEDCLRYILARLADGDLSPILIHGVTGSGKTEVYMRAIADVIKAGRQAIMLVPEISLTPQMVSVFKERFGEAAVVTHSRMTAKERHLAWQKARTGEAAVMIGPRSAVFAPFSRLGIIIIDEEHEHSYHSETTPKFDTREVAIKRGKLYGALVLMGSATPCLESYFLAEEKKYALLEMPSRVNSMFPEVHIVDMRRELASGNTSIFGRVFVEAMEEELRKDRQIILFLNRRGHSSFVSCRRCGHVMGCDSCRVNFTYHKAVDRLLCHYCGRGGPVPENCPACGTAFIRYYGVGTQKVEEEVLRLFPNVRALRMDFETTRKKHGHAKILSAFRKGEANILIGTQMIAKGLDFPKVTLVGIVAADLSLFSGDFRAAEHTFQLLTQVSGRAGRRESRGRCYIQSYQPEHYSIAMARNADYTGFYAHEMQLRRSMEYPPFAHVFVILFNGPDERELIKALHKLAAIMDYCNKKGMFTMLGPAPAFVSMIKKKFRWKLLVKCAQEDILKQFVLYCLGKLKENDSLKGITISLTLNPTAME